MFEPIEGDYSLNLAVNLAVSTGAQLGDVMRACAPLLEATSITLGPQQRTALMAQGAEQVAQELVGLAEVDIERGRAKSAGDKYLRASVLLLMAERAQPHTAGGWRDLYRQVKATFELGVRHAGRRVEFVEVPYPSSGTTIPGLFTPARDTGELAATPCLIFVNGLDSTKEMIFGTGLPDELAERGVSTLILDQPGTGASVRERNLQGIVESEHYASAALDYLIAESRADPRRVAVGGWSLGGYYAPRAAAFESRFAACVAWGAIHHYGDIQRRRLEDEVRNERPVPHYWEHVQWAFGTSSREAFLALADRMDLTVISERIRVPYLIVHSSQDRQIPQGFAERQQAAATSTQAELVQVLPKHGGVEHVGADNMRYSVCYIADWVSEVLA